MKKSKVNIVAGGLIGLTLIASTYIQFNDIQMPSLKEFFRGPDCYNPIIERRQRDYLNSQTNFPSTNDTYLLRR